MGAGSKDTTKKLVSINNIECDSLTVTNKNTFEENKNYTFLGKTNKLTIPGELKFKKAPNVVINDGSAGTSGGTTTWNSYGAGLATNAPTYKQHTVDGIKITTIYVDLEGAGAKGDAANDVIGKPAGGAAYIAKYLTADMGTLFKAQVICTETVTKSSGGGTTIIDTLPDIAFSSNATLAYDGAGGDNKFIMSHGGLLANTMSESYLSTTAANNNYIYLVEANNNATAAVLGAGKITIRLFGFV